MTDAEKLLLLREAVGEADTDETLSAYLSLAKSKILNRLYPYGGNRADLEIPARYDGLHIQITTYMLNKRGGEGETAHRENGINRTYADADIPKDLLSEIVPYCGVIGDEGA
jgi:hypothetical protein